MEATVEPKELAYKTAQIADEKKAFDISIINVGQLVDSFDYFMIASCANNRQMQMLIDEIENRLRDEDDIRPVAIEAKRQGEWSVLDFGSVVVHLFLPEIRDHYRLDSLWKDAPQEQFEADAEL